MCTNTSLPPLSGTIKPNPLSVLKNFTVPLGTSNLRFEQKIYATSEDRLRPAPRRRRRGLRRCMPRIGGDAGFGESVTTVVGASATSAVTVFGFSIEARNARPASVISQPASVRGTNDWLKTSRPGARDARRLIRSVQSEPLEIRIATARV